RDNHFVRARIAIALSGLLSAAGYAKSVNGAVVLKGPRPPEQATIKVTKDEKTCGAQLPDESLVVGPSGGLSNAVVVVVTDAVSPKDESSHLSVDQRGCRFFPHVAAVPTGATIDLSNSDSLLHNTRAMLGSTQAFNYAFPLK